MTASGTITSCVDFNKGSKSARANVLILTTFLTTRLHGFVFVRHEHEGPAWSLIQPLDTERP